MNDDDSSHESGAGEEGIMGIDECLSNKYIYSSLAGIQLLKADGSNQAAHEMTIRRTLSSAMEQWQLPPALSR